MKTIVKHLEVRDAATYIPVIAMKTQTEIGEEQEIHREIYRNRPILLIHPGAYTCFKDPSQWQHAGFGRTVGIAHKYIIDNFTWLKDLDVVDVEFILGETKEKCKSVVQEKIDDLMKLAKEQIDEDQV